jgi:hypothetical protein
MSLLPKKNGRNIRSGRRKDDPPAMKTRLTTTLAAFAVTAALAVPATAYPFDTRYDPPVTGSIGVHDLPIYESHPGHCPESSAAEGNANQQTRPVKQYGQTSGGNRC